MTQIDPYKPEDLEDILAVTLRSWAPVFQLMREDIPDYVYNAFYPQGWRARQTADVKATCLDRETELWVARTDDRVSGYLGLRVHVEDAIGEVYIIAVDPAFQRQGIGGDLLTFALDWMRERNLKIALVETGDDRGHAAARARYEKAGFERYPVARYFKRL
ncbi:MAG: GNAT family N-acetyltransferase [Pseudomonadota bacterium]